MKTISETMQDVENLLINVSEARRIREEENERREVEKLKRTKKRIVEVNEFIKNAAKNHDSITFDKLSDEVIDILKLKGYTVKLDVNNQYKVSW